MEADLGGTGISWVDWKRARSEGWEGVVVDKDNCLVSRGAAGEATIGGAAGEDFTKPSLDREESPRAKRE